MILASGSCRTHSRSIIPQLRATSGFSYLVGETGGREGRGGRGEGRGRSGEGRDERGREGEGGREGGREGGWEGGRGMRVQ